MPWQMTFKPAALTQLAVATADDAPKALEKLDWLAQDPRPDGFQKKKLGGGKGPAVYRLRVGRWRFFYTFDERYVSVLTLRRRDDHTYAEIPEAEYLGGPDDAVDEAQVEEVLRELEAPRTAVSGWIDDVEVGKPSVRPLPQPVTDALLRALRVPEGSWGPLLSAQNEDALLNAPVEPEHVGAVLDALYGKPGHVVLHQPDLLVDARDLIRYQEGELVGFLLRLSPAQERFVEWAADASGPTLLKGGPGTGKSTVALRRVAVFLEKLRAAGVARPRVLFTTYTRALTRVSEQLLDQILSPDDRACVEVATADAVAMRLYREAEGGSPSLVEPADRVPLVAEAAATAELEGSALEVASQRRTLERLGPQYLYEEIAGIVEARGIDRLEDYLAAARPGRKVALGATQRRAVWAVRERLRALLDARRLALWEDVRNRALAHATAKADAHRYDAVLVDEAQDLSPVALRLLVTLCRSPGRLFLTADANQSIYGGAFRWADVHEDLRFVGRTGTLRGNFRSTLEVARAARQYLAQGGGALDEELDDEAFHSGPLPVARTVETEADEAELLTRFLRGAARELRLAMGSAAVLCPSNDAAKRIAEVLRGRGLPATFMAPGELDLTAPGVKVLTLKAAKGLEFPIVAIAGFLDKPYPTVARGLGPEAVEEIEDRERRTLYVAMTRAMRALLVAVPGVERRRSRLLTGFDRASWNLGGGA